MKIEIHMVTDKLCTLAAGYNGNGFPYRRAIPYDLWKLESSADKYGGFICAGGLDLSCLMRVPETYNWLEKIHDPICRR